LVDALIFFFKSRFYLSKSYVCPQFLSSNSAILSTNSTCVILHSPNDFYFYYSVFHIYNFYFILTTSTSLLSIFSCFYLFHENLQSLVEIRVKSTLNPPTDKYIIWFFSQVWYQLFVFSHFKCDFSLGVTGDFHFILKVLTIMVGNSRSYLKHLYQQWVTLFRFYMVGDLQFFSGLYFHKPLNVPSFWLMAMRFVSWAGEWWEDLPNRVTLFSQ
jgi:hypothetical protein